VLAVTYTRSDQLRFIEPSLPYPWSEYSYFTAAHGSGA